MSGLARILHVEDDPDISDVVRMSLTILGGYQLKQFSSGSAAVREAQGLNVDLLMLDMMMPGLDGLETLAQLREFPEFRYTPALLFTAKTIDLPSETEAARLGIAGTIRKPFGATELPGQIQAMWDAFTQARAA